MIKRSPMGGGGVVRLLLIEMIIVILLQRIDFHLQYTPARTINQASPSIVWWIGLPPGGIISAFDKDSNDCTRRPWGRLVVVILQLLLPRPLSSLVFGFGAGSRRHPGFHRTQAASLKKLIKRHEHR